MSSLISIGFNLEGYYTLNVKYDRKVSYDDIIHVCQLERMVRDSKGIKATPYNSFLLKETVGLWNMSLVAQGACNKILRRYAQEVESYKDVHVDKPATFLGDLQPHQDKKAAFVLAKKKMLLAWEMGLGKTAFSIFCALKWKENNEIKRCLVVVPASLRTSVWGDPVNGELKKFTTESFTTAKGTKEERIAAYNSDAFFVVVSYDGVREDYDEIKKAGFDCFIIDESSAMKNEDTQNFKALKEIAPHPTHALLLNGTPIENMYQELYNQVVWLYPDEGVSDLLYICEIFGDKELENKLFKLFVSQYVLSYKKEIVLGERPPIHTERILLRMNEQQKDVYNSMEAGLIKFVNQENGEQVVSNIEDILKLKKKGLDRGEMFGRLIRLQQVCDCPSLIGVDIVEDSPKIKKLKEIHADLKSRGEKGIYFSQYKCFAEKIAKEIDGCVLFVGGMNDKDKARSIQEWKNNPDVTAIVITTAGAKGLNLVEAREIVLVDSLYNPGMIDQIIGRGDRLNRTHSMKVTYFVMDGTIEESKQLVLNKKRGLANRVLDAIQDFHTDDMENIVKEITGEKISWWQKLWRFVEGI